MDINKSYLDGISPVSTVKFGSLGAVVYEILLFAFPAAGLLLLLYLIFGGYEVMLSRGNPKMVESGKSKITNAIIGFIIVFISYWIVQALGIGLGLPDITNTFR